MCRSATCPEWGGSLLNHLSAIDVNYAPPVVVNSVGPVVNEPARIDEIRETRRGLASVPLQHVAKGRRTSAVRAASALTSVQLEVAGSVFCPLFNRQLHEHEPTGARNARVRCHYLSIVHVTGDAGRAHRGCRARLLHHGDR